MFIAACWLAYHLTIRDDSPITSHWTAKKSSNTVQQLNFNHSRPSSHSQVNTLLANHQSFLNRLMTSLHQSPFSNKLPSVYTTSLITSSLDDSSWPHYLNSASLQRSLQAEPISFSPFISGRFRNENFLAGMLQVCKTSQRV